MSLSHSSPECTGRWGPRIIEGRIYAVCEDCGATGADLVEDHDAAICLNLVRNPRDQPTKQWRKLLDRL